jgi:hypothetical protein
MKASGMQFSLGFMKPIPVWPFGSDSSSGRLVQAARLVLLIRGLASAARM